MEGFKWNPLYIESKQLLDLTISESSRGKIYFPNSSNPTDLTATWSTSKNNSSHVLHGEKLKVDSMAPEKFTDKNQTKISGPLPLSNKFYQSRLLTMAILDSHAVPPSPQKPPKLKLDMEKFSDLNTYCKRPVTPSLSTQSSLDELNTPIFELTAPFDFDRQPNVGSEKCSSLLKSQQKNKCIKSEINNDNVFIANENDMFSVGDPSEGATELHSYYSSPTNGSNKSSILSSEMDVLSPDNSNYFTYDKSILAPVKTEKNNEGLDFFTNESLMVTDDFDVLASEGDTRHSTNIKLDITEERPVSEDILQTPDIIDTLDSFVTEKDFNILHFINDEDIKVATSDLFPTIQDIPPSYDSSPVTPEDSETSYSVSPVETHSYALPPQDEDIYTQKRSSSRKRRIKREEEDDEDYVPPSERKIARKRIANKSPKLLLDNAVNLQLLEELSKTSRRGRPPKSRLSSISSESSEFPPHESEYRYREMRDKNNEASRRSRFKRKLKEMAVENEAEALSDRNVKLKAQVEELEKTVSTFRTNLMKLLMSK